MMVRLDFGGGAATAARALRVRPRPGDGIVVVAECGPHLPFRDSSVDELFIGRAISERTDLADTLDELWRVSRPGALLHLRLPHASSIVAITRSPRAQPMMTLDTFNYYDPRTAAADDGGARFTVERAHLHLAGRRGDDSGLALARGPLAQFIEKLANGSRGAQYRFERWFAGLFGGFEEFSVVLAAVKPERPAMPHEPRRQSAGAARDDAAGAPPAGTSLPHEPFTSGTFQGGPDAR